VDSFSLEMYEKSSGGDFGTFLKLKLCTICQLYKLCINVFTGLGKLTAIHQNPWQYLRVERMGTEEKEDKDMKERRRRKRRG